MEMWGRVSIPGEAFAQARKNYGWKGNVERRWMDGETWSWTDFNK